jgi:nitrite reductase/ring-hydroxylating ferredoxin subunit
MNDCDDCRRRLLKAGVAGAAVLLVPGCSSATSDPVTGDDGGSPEGGDDASGDGGGDGGACQTTCATGTKTVELSFTKYPQLKSVGGSASVQATGYSDPSCGQPDIIVAQPTAGTYVAFSASCSHMCCVVGFVKKSSEFLCPCHSSTFDMSGQVTGGPAPTGLHQLTVCADACGVYVTLP